MARHAGWRSSGAIPPAPQSGAAARQGRLPLSAARLRLGRSHAASILGHMLLLACALAIWGGATVVPAPPAELAVALDFAPIPQPTAAAPPALPQAEAPLSSPSEPASPVPAPVAEPPPPAPTEPPPTVPARLVPAPQSARPGRHPALVPLPQPREPAKPKPPRPDALSAAAPPAPAAAPSPLPATSTAAAARPATAPVAAPRSVRLLSDMSGTCPGVYPPVARRRGEQGQVLLHIEVAADGLPGAVHVVSSSGSIILDGAAMAAARGCRHFPPASGPYIAEVPYTYRQDN